jgi:D-glycero-alpha-D-manno-heptose-7-phosphate kinase
MLGHPGGKQDEYGSAFGGLKHIEFSTEGVAVDVLDLDPVLLRELDQRLMLFNIGNARSSAEILSRQKDDCRDEKKSTLDALDELKEMVAEGLALLKSGNLNGFGRLLHMAWEAKKRVSAGISTPTIDALYATARAAGALGGKVTGAGGGGFLLVYSEHERREAVAEAMRAAGAREMFFSFDYDGARAVYNDQTLQMQDAHGLNWQLVELG